MKKVLIMKRDIKFRGKRVRTEDPLERWIEGSYVEYTNIRDEKIIKIMSQSGYMNDINPETVGQFTGLCDKNGKEIYEGDIVECNGDICKVMYSNHYAGFALDKKGWLYLHFFGEAFSNKDCLVIGNIHDNIELLKENNHE